MYWYYNAICCSSVCAVVAMAVVMAVDGAVLVFMASAMAVAAVEDVAVMMALIVVVATALAAAGCDTVVEPRHVTLLSALSGDSDRAFAFPELVTR